MPEPVRPPAATHAAALAQSQTLRMVLTYAVVAALWALLFVLLRRLLKANLVQALDHAQASEGHLRTERLLTTIVEHSADCIFAKDLEGRYLLINARALQALGCTAQQALGHTDEALFPPALAATARAGDRLVIDDNRAASFEQVLASPDGPRTFQATKVPLHDAHGRVVGLFGIARDITGRKRMESELRRSEQRYRQMIERSPEAIVVHRSGTILYVNPAALRMAGVAEAGDAIGHRLLEFAPVDGKADIVQRTELLAAANADSEGVESRLQRADGRVVEVAVRGATIAFDGDEAIQVTMRDITGRKQTERALLASQVQLRATLNAIPDLLFELDLDGRYMAVYTPTQELLAAPPKALLGRTVPELLPVGPAGLTMDAIAQAHATGFSGGTQVALDLPIGRRWFELSIARKDALPGEGPRFIALSRDITRRKQDEELLQAALRDKDALLKEVHHRVKNNLQVIDSLLRMEGRRHDHAPTRAVLQDMQGRIHAMALLHETLYRSGTFAGVELGAYLRQLVTRAFQALGHGAVRLTLDLATVHVEMDQATPCGLLTNELVSNCLKHGFPDGRTGEVQVRVALVDGGPELLLQVGDTGIGLPDDFEARRQQSLGLQLAGDLAGQIGGQLDIGPGPAAQFSVRFVAQPPRLGQGAHGT